MHVTSDRGCFIPFTKHLQHSDWPKPRVTARKKNKHTNNANKQVQGTYSSWQCLRAAAKWELACSPELNKAGLSLYLGEKSRSSQSLPCLCQAPGHFPLLPGFTLISTFPLLPGFSCHQFDLQTTKESFCASRLMRVPCSGFFPISFCLPTIPSWAVGCPTGNRFLLNLFLIQLFSCK